MKRMTKAQKEAAQKAALLQRLQDIYAGANSGWVSGEEWATAEVIERVMVAVRSTFLDDKTDDFRIGCHVVGKYDTPEDAALFLYEHEVRA
jgi:hypothetical protein